VNAIAEYRRAAGLRKEGLSEERIGVRMGVRQWTVSRLLALRDLDEDVARIFEGEDVASLSALAEIARWPAEDQGAAIGELRRMKEKKARTVRRRDVVQVMVRRTRNLDRAPFPTAACRKCAKRTGAQADFFGGVAPDALGRCRDAACFARCMNAVAARRARWAKKEDFRAIPARTKKGVK